MDPALRAAAQKEVPGETEAIIRLAPGAAPPPQVRLIARFGEIATCRLPRERIWEVWSEDEVTSLKAPWPFGIDPDPLEGTSADAEEWDAGASDVRRPPDLTVTGDGILVGIVDWGFDFAHPNLRDPSGLTRIRALWDQSAPGAGPEPYGYGRVFRREEIDAALASDDPYTTMGYHPASGDPQGRGAHGTHVVDIAAGSGMAADSPLGMAPGAELLCVHMANRGTEGLATLGDSVTLLEALHWIFREAGDTPCVVNLSVGRHGGPHNGLTLVEQAIDAALVEEPGRCVVQSNGNYYAADSHAEHRLAPGQEWTFRWITDRADVTPNELEVWYPGRDVLTLEIRPPGAERVVRVGIGQEQPIEIGGQEVGRAYHRARDPAAGDNHIDVFLARTAPAGEWQITLRARDVVDGRVYVWVERDAGCPSCQSRLSPQDAVASCTTGTICNGFRTISVGAYRAQSPRRELAPFSSAGPTRDGRSKPDLVAPGVRVLAARSAPQGSGPAQLLFRQSGTSMAAPHVTGTVALMFQAAGRPLAIHETRSLLLSAAEPPVPDEFDAGRHGSGFLNVTRAVALAEASLDWADNDAAPHETAQATSFVGGEPDDSHPTETDEPECEWPPPDKETFKLPDWAYEPECLRSAPESETFELPQWAYEPELLHVSADDESFKLPEWAYAPEFLPLPSGRLSAAGGSCACCERPKATRTPSGPDERLTKW
jgi:subtilisin family serine protease